MKVTKNDYARMQQLINDCIQECKIKAYECYPGISERRYHWDIYHATIDRLQYKNKEDYLFLRSLYDYCNDNHNRHGVKKHY